MGVSSRLCSLTPIYTAASIILFVIQAVIVLVPIGVFLGLPGWLLWRVVRRRIHLRRAPPDVTDSD